MVYCRHGTSSRHETGFRSAGAAAPEGRTAARARCVGGRGGSPGRRAPPVGEPLGADAGREGGEGAPTPRPRGTQAAAHGCGAAPHRAGAQTWARGVWVSHESVDHGTGRLADRRGNGGALPPWPRLAHPTAPGVELPTTGGQSQGAKREGDCVLEESALAAGKKTPRAKGERSSSSTRAD